jgi:hypothetical protein
LITQILAARFVKNPGRLILAYNKQYEIDHLAFLANRPSHTNRRYWHRIANIAFADIS